MATYQGLMNLLEPNADSYHGILLEYRTGEEMLPFVAEPEMALLPYSPIMQGLLSDSYVPGDVGPDDVRRDTPRLFGPDAAVYRDAAARLRELASDMGRPLQQIAINSLAAQAGMGPAIAGAETVEQLEAIAGAGSWDLTVDELAAVTAAATVAD